MVKKAKQKIGIKEREQLVKRINKAGKMYKKI